MKKLLLLIGVFLSLTAHAVDLANPDTKYLKELVNPDSTVSILDPKIQDASGVFRYVSYYDSNDGGLCKRFGFATSVASQPTDITDEGNFESVYHLLICNPKEYKPEKSLQYTSLRKNSDGSVEIDQPRFDYDGQKHPLSYSESSDRGVCKLFGFASFISDESTDGEDYQIYSSINQNGHLAALGTADKIYQSITCGN